MPLHAGKGSTSAAAGFLESNHSLSTNPYLPFFFFFFNPRFPPSSSSLPPVQTIKAWQAQVPSLGEKTQLEKNKQTKKYIESK